MEATSTQEAEWGNPLELLQETELPDELWKNMLQNNVADDLLEKYLMPRVDQAPPEINNNLAAPMWLVSQPAVYQVAHYNIYPSPELRFNFTSPEPLTVVAQLIYRNEVYIAEGFTEGGVQLVKPGEKSVTFTNLHLNKMKPVVNLLKKNTYCGSSKDLGQDFSIRWVVNGHVLESCRFFIKSATSQIPPEYKGVRPRLKSTDVATEEPAPAAPVVEKAAPKKKKKSTPKSEDVFYHVRVRGDLAHRGFINVRLGTTLAVARSQLSISALYPTDYLFWCEVSKSVVAQEQEGNVLLEHAIVDNSLVLNPVDPTTRHIHIQLLNLWMKQIESVEPLVPWNEISTVLCQIYDTGTRDPQELNIIAWGISHFLQNVSRQNKGHISLDDFNLFLKYFGPIEQSLQRVLSVYGQSYFHGFLKSSDARNLLMGRPGGYLIRYSESQLKDACFAVTVNKGSFVGEDIIESYSFKYHANTGQYVFRGRNYSTLRALIQDPDSSGILKVPISKISVDDVGALECNYQSEDDFLTSFGQLHI